MYKNENGKRHVLLVDDSRHYLIALEILLKKADFNVTTAGDGAEAISHLKDKSGNFDVIVSDLLMPNVDGVGLAEYNYGNGFIPLVIFTSLADAQVALSLTRFGVQDYLVKPFEESVFLGVVKNAVMRSIIRKYDAEAIGNTDVNMASIAIPSTTAELQRLRLLIEERVGMEYGRHAGSMFTSYLFEFLQNSHEHGNLRIDENAKSIMLEDGSYDDEIKRREAVCASKIYLDLTFLDREIGASISDEGEGFDYEKYLTLTPDDILQRITMPNGRGIYMARSYFDTIRYEKGGSSVMVTKYM